MTAARPANNAPIATLWGQEIHDQTHTPRGGSYAGATVAGIGTAYTKLPLSVQHWGAPWLNGGDILISVAGWYHIVFWIEITALGGAVHAFNELRVNGTALLGANIQPCNLAGTRLQGEMYHNLVVGDRLNLYTKGSAGTAGMGATPWMQIIRTAEAVS